VFVSAISADPLSDVGKHKHRSAEAGKAAVSVTLL